MGKVYQCDRCGAIEKIGAVGDESFAGLKYGLVGCTLNHEVLLCPHCMKKLEDFLSNPNCIKEEVHHCGTCEYQFENGICPRTYTCSNDSIACKKWKLKEVGK
jgi:hypothetical protein